MCGRFTQNYSWAELHALMRLTGPAQNLRPRYNIAPTTNIDVIHAKESDRELTTMRWGLVPFFWKKTLKEAPSTFNARAETAAEKPMFRSAFKNGRCIIPASGFYEWTGGKKDRQPHLFTARDGSPILAFAGLLDKWRAPEGEELLSCTIIVSGANEWMTSYHDRMPVLLKADEIDGWLSGSLGQEVLKPAEEGALREWPVSKRVNRTGVGDDDPTLIEPEFTSP
jgi:putative SOS response-associated peptidase YedK